MEKGFRENQRKEKKEKADYSKSAKRKAVLSRKNKHGPNKKRCFWTISIFKKMDNQDNSAAFLSEV